MSAFSFVTLISSSMIAPALPTIARELSISSDVELPVIFSAFILAGAVGPLLFAPLSEIYGRRIVMLGGNVFYIVWTIVCGFAPNKALMIVGRFLSGLGASVTFGVQMGTLSDCWRAENRGKSVAILGFAPLLGPALGPIFGGLIVQSTSWRWIFWSITLFDGALQVLAWFLFSETYAPVLLARKAHKLRHSTGNLNFYTAFETTQLTPRQRLANSLVRPLRITVTHAAARTITVYGCVSFGTLYIILSDFASLWIERYQQSASVGGLHYLAIVLGFLTAVVVGARFTDRTWQRADTPTPELRVFFVMPGGACMAAGLLVYGWAAQNKLHWIVPDLGVAIFGLGA